MFPRFSETFVLTELLALQQHGVPVGVFSLRLPDDGRFHRELSLLEAPVHHIGGHHLRTAELWALLGAARTALPGLVLHLDDLLDAEVGEAAQAVLLAGAAVENGITHLHAHFASIAARVARLAARLAGITYSVTAHAKDIFVDDIDDAELARTLGDAHTVVTISRYNADHLAARFPEIGDRLRLVRNGIDLAGFPFRADLVHRPPRIAAIGRLVEKKGFGYLLQAAALLRDRGVGFHLDLVGTGALATVLAADVQQLGLADRVRLHGAQPQDRVREVVAGAAVLAAPCVVGADGNRDGLPTVLLEAMALGTPCVSTPVTGIGEAVVPGRTGLLVPERDPRALADALESLLTDRALGAGLAAAARRLVEQDYDTRRQAAAVAAGFGVPTAAPEGALR
ncbi:glycosyltransferase [Nakamurella sp. YIM 132087]|uniref:Glycosyltransferase n=2 Tax=Nakamurella alba TaxID=2665158 RepID=A0A7K1FJK8_9ACTN|nr:glycosyltransferase [Nakamurella alba]